MPNTDKLLVANWGGEGLEERFAFAGVFRLFPHCEPLFDGAVTETEDDACSADEQFHGGDGA